MHGPREEAEMGGGGHCSPRTLGRRKTEQRRIKGLSPRTRGRPSQLLTESDKILALLLSYEVAEVTHFSIAAPFLFLSYSAG